MQLSSNEVHIWSANLAISSTKENELRGYLSIEEQLRAERLHFSHHKTRFIAGRGFLRQLLGWYLNVAPATIVFTYSLHQKPSIVAPQNCSIQFNVAHSHDQALYAITLHYPLGIDVEKFQDNYNRAVAERYFNSEEKQMLFHLPHEQQAHAFYRLWARKESLVKAIGEGLKIPLNSFSVLTNQLQIDQDTWSIQSLNLFTDYASAITTQLPAPILTYYRFLPDGYQIINPSEN